MTEQTGGSRISSQTSSFDELNRVLDALNGSTLSVAATEQVMSAIADAYPDDQRRSASHAPTGPAQEVFLQSLSVSGFRGVHEKVTLELQPSPGLTVVAGRNGSGKSSLAEAIDVVLTGASARWKDRSVTWRDSWQHLSGGGVAITAKFAVSSVPGGVVLDFSAKPGIKPEQAAPVAVTWPGLRSADLASCGWAEAIRQFRPVLSYNELGGLIEGSSAEQYRALSSVLDLERLEDAAIALTQRRLAGEREKKDLESERKAVKAQALAVDDPRATALVAALDAKKSPDFAAIDQLMTNGDTSLPGLQPIRRLAALHVAQGEDAQGLVQQVLRAQSTLAAVGSVDVKRASAMAGLLSAATSFFQEHQQLGERCAVCGDGVLTDQWLANATIMATDLRRQASELKTANDELARVTRDAVTVIVSARNTLSVLKSDAREVDAASCQALVATVDATVTAVDERFSNLDLDPEGAQHRPADWWHGVATLIEQFGEGLSAVREAARAEVEQRNSAWMPVRDRVVVWRAGVGNPVARSAAIDAAKEAEHWLQGQTAVVRAARFAPIQERAAEVWSRLRRDSNVELAEILLDKKGKIGKVDVQVNVDGTHVAGLGVLSQGEIHAMALSLFLPRASAAQSPFKFLVIDDPVQAMDPSRVEALAQVLGEEALTRQIVVFTHDERFAQAVERLHLKARMITVTRSQQGAMKLDDSHGPTVRLLRDASALLKTENVPLEVMSRVVPNLCRQAIESACDVVLRRRWISAGVAHADVEARLSDAKKVMHRVALVLFDDENRTGEVLRRLSQENAAFATAVVEANKGTHGSGEKPIGELDQLHQATRKLCGWLEARP